MSCNCAPSGESLPLIEDDRALNKPTALCKPCVSDANCLASDQSEGTTLDSSWQDAGRFAEDLTILARVGNKLARFGGTGFIQLVAGKASVVSTVPLKISTIWHRWWKTTAAHPPILGEPLPYPYQVIADSEGNLHVGKGTDAEDSVSVWNSTTMEFSQKPLSELALAHKGILPRLAALELVGYAPLPSLGSTAAVRNLSTLAGSGLVVVSQVTTVADPTANPCDDSLASVASFLELPSPVADESYTLKFSTALGLYWSEN